MRIRGGTFDNRLAGNVFTRVNTLAALKPLAIGCRTHSNSDEKRSWHLNSIRAKFVARRMFAEHEKNTFFS